MCKGDFIVWFWEQRSIGTRSKNLILYLNHMAVSSLAIFQSPIHFLSSVSFQPPPPSRFVFSLPLPSPPSPSPPTRPYSFILALPYDITLPYSASTHPLEIPVHFGSVLHRNLIASNLLLPFAVLSPFVFISNINFLPCLLRPLTVPFLPFTVSMTNA